MKQISFNFTFEKEEIDDFIISISNKYAFTMVDKWPLWQSHATLIYGPKLCGKSMLAKHWQKKTNAIYITKDNINSINIVPKLCYIIEDIENIKDELKLLEIFNKTNENNCYLLISSNKPPSLLGIELQDLSSRLKSISCAEIGNPDDVIFKIFLQKEFSDRQLRVKDDVLKFILNNIERSFLIAKNFVEELDKHSLQEKRNITIPFAKKLLSKFL